MRLSKEERSNLAHNLLFLIRADNVDEQRFCAQADPVTINRVLYPSGRYSPNGATLERLAHFLQWPDHTTLYSLAPRQFQQAWQRLRKRDLPNSTTPARVIQAPRRTSRAIHPAFRVPPGITTPPKPFAPPLAEMRQMHDELAAAVTELDAALRRVQSLAALQHRWLDQYAESLGLA